MLIAILAVVAQLPPAPPPVHVDSAGPAVPAPETLTSWQVGEVRCNGAPIRPLRMERPYPALRYGDGDATSVTLSFRIDADGRPLGITPSSQFGDATDLAPALAASLFAAGQPQDGCTVRYAGTALAVSVAPLADAMEFTIFPATRPTRMLWERVKPAGTSCFDPPPALRNRSFPDFDRIAQPAGTTSWSMIGFDIDAGGEPVARHVVAGSGLAPLDQASLEAVGASRFGPDRRTGCLYPYFRRGGTLAAPMIPEEAATKPAGATCPTHLEWARHPALDFPEPFRRRSIEGWAVISYDVAPWGETGNIKVLAAEPADVFGDYGVRAIRSGRKVASTGYSGCVDRVRFVMGYKQPPNAVTEPAPAY